MARQTQEKEIDGLRFAVQQLPAMRSMRLLHKLARAIGPGLLKSLSGAGDVSAGVKVADMDVGDMADGIGMVFDRFSADDLEALIRELFESATVAEGGNTLPLMPVFDNVMAGRPTTVLKAVRFALEVNYRDFFGALLASAQGLGAGPSSSVKG